MDPYQVLQVDDNDPIETIKAAYHKLLLKYHPDKARARGEEASTTQQFLAIQQAWKTISDIENDPSTYKTVNSDEVPFADLELREVAEQMNARP
jgi:DnaJ-class molecular chaperone